MSDSSPRPSRRQRCERTWRCLARGELSLALPEVRELAAILARELAATGSTATRRASLNGTQRKDLRRRRIRAAIDEKARPEVEAADVLELLSGAALVLVRVDPAAARDVHARHLALALDARAADHVARSLAYAGAVHATSLRPASRRAKALLTEARALARDERSSAHVDLAVATLARERGEWQSARELARPLVARCHGDDAAAERFAAALLDTEASLYLGEVRDARRLAMALVDDARAREDRLNVVTLGTGPAALALLATGHAAILDDIVAEADRLAAREEGAAWLRYAVVNARALGRLYAGDGRGASQLVERAWPELRRAGVVRAPAFTVEALDLRARAALAAGLAGWSEGFALAGRVARQLRALELPWPAALATLLESALLRVRGQERGALRLMSTAEAELVELGMHLHEVVVRRRRGQLVGGAAGQGLITSSEAYLRKHGMTAPEAVCAVLAPAP